MSPNPMKRSHTIGLQVFLLLFFFYLNREPHLALSLSQTSEPPSLWRRGRSLGDMEGFTLDDRERERAQEARLLVPTCRPHSSWSDLCRGSLGSITCFQPTGRKEPLFFPPIPPVPPPPFSVSVVQQRYRLHSRLRPPFHLPCQAVSLRMIAVNIVYTP